MEPQNRSSLSTAVRKILYPLIRILLRNGIPAQAFMELARAVYVEVAAREFGVKDRKQTDSRVSTITGLSRKEVRRLRKLQPLSDADAVDRYNRAARVISGWLKDRRFSDGKGNPRLLRFEKGRGSFSDLVKAYSGDVPPRAILDELRNVGTVEAQPDGRIKLRTRAYLPVGDEPGLLSILGTDVSHLIKSIDHNIARGDVSPFFQRKVSYDNVPSEAAPQFRKLSAEKAQKLLELLDRWLARHDRDVTPSVGGTGRRQVGLGIYYFEDDLEQQSPDSTDKGKGKCKPTGL